MRGAEERGAGRREREERGRGAREDGGGVGRSSV